MSNMMHTKFGNTKISDDGYYRITSRKEGNFQKYLHRLIFEEFYGWIPDGYHVHHKDGNKLNNCIMNLQLIKKDEHHRLHQTGETNSNYGKTPSLETMIKMSKHNSTGYFRVSKEVSDTFKNGCRYKYCYHEDGKHKSISCVDLETLEKKVKARGLKWFKFDEVDC